MHDVSRLSGVTKLQYLKLCLTDGAAELIKDVTTTNANYASAWQALNDRYHNPRLIINKHLTAFMEIPHMKKESASEVRTFLDESERIVRALTNLELPVEHWGIWLVFLLSDRLDPDSRRLWEAELREKERGTGADENQAEPNSSSALPKYSDLVMFLQKRVQTLSMLASERKAEKRPASTSTSSSHPRKVFHASSSRSSGPPQCPLCNGTHTLTKCFKLKDKIPHERLSTVRRLQVCFNCFGSHKV